ncbi:hypothetical protein TBK1r_49770 [Stieleria magnilauensis]|uniref:Uncharacterized protein n=1 Tax=Stieleria magnilauensis TaxID=2527963 RepID=A0ABX5XYF1_9BACT|nr:hypothetical protein TBK1r_49770 [Planctomycetes bacterium TBK1r]
MAARTHGFLARCHLWVRAAIGGYSFRGLARESCLAEKGQAPTSKVVEVLGGVEPRMTEQLSELIDTGRFDQMLIEAGDL